MENGNDGKQQNGNGSQPSTTHTELESRILVHSSEGSSKRPPTLQDVELAFKRNYDPHLWDACRAALATIGALSIQERTHCLVLIFEGPASSGKSIVISSLDPPKNGPEEEYLYRSDDFTPASFVSHASDKTERELAKIDLLPRIVGRCLLTKELAPLFQADEHRLRDNFAKLTSILDGKGHSSDSGAHGKRSVTGDLTFNWIGATTRIPPRTYDLMGRMGSRLLMYEFPDVDVPEDEVVDFICNYEPAKAEKECHTAATGFVLGHFDRHPISSIPEGTIVIPKEPYGRQIARYAMLVAHGRQLDLKEGPWRVGLLLRMLAQGSAIISGRYVINQADVDIVRHTAISTLPYARRKVVQQLQTKGAVYWSDSKALHKTEFTRMQLEDVVKTGLARRRGEHGIELEKQWAWLQD